MTKRKSNKTPKIGGVKSVSETVEAPVRTSVFRFADVGRGPVPLGSNKTIHGAD